MYKTRFICVYIYIYICTCTCVHVFEAALGPVVKKERRHRESVRRKKRRFLAWVQVLWWVKMFLPMYSWPENRVKRPIGHLCEISSPRLEPLEEPIRLCGRRVYFHWLVQFQSFLTSLNFDSGFRKTTTHKDVRPRALFLL